MKYQCIFSSIFKQKLKEIIFQKRPCAQKSTQIYEWIEKEKRAKEWLKLIKNKVIKAPLHDIIDYF